MRASSSSFACAIGFVIVGVAAFGACGGSEQGTPPYSGPPDDAPTLSMDDYCAQSLQLTCDALTRCCPGVGAPPNCSAYAGQYCDTLRKSAPAGTAYDPVAGGVCVAAERASLSGSCGAVTEPATLALAACNAIFNGGVAPGGACTANSDCAYRRRAIASCRGGVCTSQPIVGAGAACGAAMCDVDLVCSASSPSPSDAGTDAGTDADASTGAVCVPAAAAGESCATTLCRHDLRCDTTSHTCVAYLADGAPCTQSTECSSRQCTGGKCEPSTTCGL